MKNTRVQYLYRDAGNYKTDNEVIIPGEMTDDQLHRIRVAVITGNYFLPRKVGLPERRGENFSEADPEWFEFVGIQHTDELENLDVDPETLTKRFEACSKDWFGMPDIEAW